MKKGYIQNWADAVIVRHRDISMLEIMANTLSIPVVNAMTDENHPCEIMSDLYTLSKIRTDYLRDNYLFVGADGNIGRAWKEVAEAFGFSLNQSSPSRYQIPGVSCNENLKEAIVGKDIICTDSIPSSMIDDFKNHQISKGLMSMANENAILNLAFLKAGLLDEVDILIGPGIDGRAEMPYVFEGRKESKPLPLILKDLKRYDDGTVLLQYKLG